MSSWSPVRFFCEKNFIFLPVILLSILAGGCAGWFAAHAFVLSSPYSLGGNSIPIATTTTAKIEVVRVEPRPVTPAFPPAFVTRRLSPVLTLVKRGGGRVLAEHVVAVDHEIGSASALTSDGWLMSSLAVFNGYRLADVAAVWNGRTYPLQKGVRDKATDILFLKIDATDLPVADFVRADDVAWGSTLWIEPRSKQLYPGTLVDIRVQNGMEAVSSEYAARRFLVAGSGDASWSGGAVWDAAGHLAGMLETKVGNEWRVVPAVNASAALQSLLTSQEIRHAYLGVHALDLASFALDQGRELLPFFGGWLRASRRDHALAVDLLSPAASQLHDGDVIERVESDILDGTVDLGERLLDYRPGITLTLSGHRKKEPFEVKVLLGSVVTSEPLK